MDQPIIVDTHMHLYRSGEESARAKASYEIWEYDRRAPGRLRFSDRTGMPEDALQAMREAGARRAIIANLLDAPTPGADPGADLFTYNRWLCDLAQRHDEFVPFIGIDPRFHPVATLVRHLRDMVREEGARGIKLHPPVQHLDLGDRGFWSVFEACRELDVAVLSHSGPTRSDTGSGEPNAFRPVLEAFPGLRIILAHLGGAAWRQTAALAADFPDVHFDCCEIVEWIGAANAPSEDEFVQLVRSIGPERVLMGTDFPWYDIDHTAELIRALPGLSDAEKAGILGGNAMRFLGEG